MRVLAAVALAGLLAPNALPAQERETGEREWAPGLVLDEGGGWRVPTAVEALRALRGGPKPYNPSVWCEAGRFLMYEPGASRPRRPDDVADPPDPEVFEQLC